MDKESYAPLTRLTDREAAELFQSSNVAMVVTDPRLDDNPIVYVNRAFERLTGYAAEMALGRNCRFLQGDDTDPEVVARLQRGIKRVEEISVVLKNYKANGEPFLNALLISPIHDADGKLAYFVGLQHAISKDRQAERL